MNELQKYLLDTMQLFTQDSIQKNERTTLTIECKIIDIVDKEGRQYLVQYMNNSFTTLSNGDYNVGDNVYVLIPNGDLEKEKMIIGSTSSTKVQDENNLPSSYNDIGIKFFEITTENKTDKQLVELPIEIKNEFVNYLSDDYIFCLQAEFLTEKKLEDEPYYGLKLIIPAAKGDGNIQEIVETLDVYNMSGSPYQFYNWSSQSLYFTIDKDYNVNTDGIKLQFISEDESVSVRNISLAAMQKAEEDTKTGYSLSIAATHGVYFSQSHGNETEKTLTPIFKVNGKQNSLNKAEIYWLIEDAGVQPGDDDYNKYGGRGYRWLNKDDNTLKEYKVTIATTYKCVIVYGGKSISATIELKNLYPQFSFLLDGKSSYKPNSGNVSLSAIVKYQNEEDKDYQQVIRYHWARYDKDGQYLDDLSAKTDIKTNTIEDKQFTTTIEFPVSLVNENNLIKCTAYYITSKEDVIIGSDEITIVTKDDITYIINIEGGDRTYKYDAAGNAPTSKNYIGQDAEPVNLTLTYTVRRGNGDKVEQSEITDVEWITQDNSLIQKDNDNTDDTKFVYTLAAKYNYTKALNSSVILRLTIGDEVIDTNANIGILQEGTNGTNGTPYSVRFVQEKQVKLVLNKSYNQIDFDKPIIKVYKDNEVITENINISYKIIGNDKECIEVNSKSGVLSYTNGTYKEGSINILQVTVKTDGDRVIYAYCPIDIVIVNNEAEKSIEVLGYSEVMYENDGTTPTYEEEYFDVEGVPVYNSIVWKEIGENLTWKNNKIVPMSTFNGEMAENAVIGTFTKPTAVDITKREEYKETIEEIEKELADLEALKSLAEKFKYKEWCEAITNSNALLLSVAAFEKSDIALQAKIKDIQDAYGDTIPEDISGKLKLASNHELHEIQVPAATNSALKIDLEEVNLLLSDYWKANDNLNAAKLTYQAQEETLKETIEKVQAWCNGSTNLLETHKKLMTIAKNKAEELSLESSIKENLQIIDYLLKTIFVNIFELNSQNKVVLKENLTNQKNKLETELTTQKTVLDNYDTIVEDTNDTITIIHPIVMYYNRYSFENINAWDGNKVQVEEGYIISPQVIAGSKDSENTFTGITIGNEKNNKGTTTKIGLFGYYKGQRSIFLNATDGSATFGLNGESQIIIDPSDSNKAILKSGNYDITKGTGMQIDLSKPEIKFGSGKFTVDSEGELTSTAGTIGGWTINDTYLKGGQITLNKDGKIYSNNHNKLENLSSGFYLSEDGLSIGSKFTVDSEGKLTASNVAVTGSVTATYLEAATSGKIGGWTINKTYLKGDNIELNSNGSMKGTNWSISTNGKATFSDVTITNGNGANQSSMKWVNGNNTVFSVSPEGVLSASNATVSGTVSASSGSVGNWNISDGAISNGNTSLTSTGLLDIRGDNGRTVIGNGIFFTSNSYGGTQNYLYSGPGSDAYNYANIAGVVAQNLAVLNRLDLTGGIGTGLLPTKIRCKDGNYSSDGIIEVNGIKHKFIQGIYCGTE